MDNINSDRKEYFEKLYQIIKRLRAPNGCPWDLEQTAISLRKDLLEEVYECIDAIDTGDNENLKEELGDLFLLLTMITRIKEQEGVFSLEEVLETICAKLIRRHPHVFGNDKITEIEDIIKKWDSIKENIEGKKNIKSIFENIPSALPPLEKANAIQKKAAKVGFEWDAIEPVFAKLEEEVGELKFEYEQGNRQKTEEELGDVLFTVVNIARKMKIDPTLALNRTNCKFIKRFQEIESILKEKNMELAETDLKFLDSLWDEIKLREKQNLNS